MTEWITKYLPGDELSDVDLYEDVLIFFRRYCPHCEHFGFSNIGVGFYTEGGDWHLSISGFNTDKETYDIKIEVSDWMRLPTEPRRRG